MSRKTKTLTAQIDSLVLALARDVAAIRRHKIDSDNTAVLAAMESARLNSSEALGLQRLKMRKGRRVVDNPAPHEESKPGRR